MGWVDSEHFGLYTETRFLLRTVLYHFQKKKLKSLNFSNFSIQTINQRRPPPPAPPKKATAEI